VQYRVRVNQNKALCGFMIQDSGLKI